MNILKFKLISLNCKPTFARKNAQEHFKYANRSKRSLYLIQIFGKTAVSQQIDLRVE